MVRRVAVLTSGGDAPGMNAAIRAVVRTGVAKGWEMFGVRLGYEGLINGKIIPLGTRDVGGIIQRGGTMLGSARSMEFKTEDGQLRAMRSLNEMGIDALVVVGGNGSQSGANSLNKLGFPTVGIASTIDNDLYGPDITIGVDTALNIAIEAIDRLKTTASSHQRAFVIEVMGLGCGYLALMAGIAGGAEFIVIPEVPCDPEEIAQGLKKAYQRGKEHAIIVVAEGAEYNAKKLDEFFLEHQERLGFELRTTILGHVQRGGAPTSCDRILASRSGAMATEMIAKGRFGVLVGLINNKIGSIPLEEAVSTKKQLDPELIDLAKILD
jgi:6-phosphofructokinase 1